MSSIAGSSLSITGASTLNGLSVSGSTAVGAIQASGSFSQSGTSTFSTGSGLVSLNGSTVTSSTVSVGTNLTVNGTSALVGATTISGLLQANGGVNAGSATVQTTGTVSCGTLSVGSGGETDTGILSVGGLLSANGGLTVNSTKTLTLPSNRAITSSNDVVDTSNIQTIAGVKTFSNQIIANSGIDTGGSSITCGTLICSSETDAGTLTVGGLLTANNGIFIANNKSISTNDTGGALLFTGLGFSSTYAPNTGYGLGLTMNQNSNGEVSLFSLKNNSANAGGFSFYDYYTTTPTKTLLASLNISNGLTTNNLPINTGTGTITCGGLNSATNINITGYGTSNIFQYSNGQLYFTNNYTTPASSAYGNSGFNFRNYYNSGGGNAYQNFLLINDKTDGTNYYNNNVLPIYASGGLVVPSSKTISSTTDLYFTATNGENIMKLGGDNSSEILQLYKNSVGSYLNQGNSYMSIRQDMGSDQGIIVGIDASSFSQFNAQAYIDTIRGGVSGNTPLNLKVCGSTVMQLFSTGVNILNGSTSSNSVLQILPQSTYTQINCTNGSNSLTQPLVLNNNNGYGVCINTSTPQSGYQLTVNGSIYTGGTIYTTGGLSITTQIYGQSGYQFGPTTAPAPSVNAGGGSIGWNKSATAVDGINGEFDLTCFPQAGTGGFVFYNWPDAGTVATNPTVLASLNASGLFIPKGGLTIPSGQSLTVNGTFTSSTITASGLITANAGVAMGSNQNITLASTFTAPTTGQLGSIITSTFTTATSIPATTTTNIGSITIGVGVWIVNWTMSLATSIGNSTITSIACGIFKTNSVYTGSIINNASAQTSFQETNTGGYLLTTTGLLTRSGTNIVNYSDLTSGVIYLNVNQAGGTSVVNKNSYIIATRIA